jgi:8-oxo-dGTP diphosphatase
MIHKAGLLVVRGGRVLLCRKKHGTLLLILPGGKIEPGESAAGCVEREVREELGPDVRPSTLEFLGQYTDQAAGSAGEVCVELFSTDLEGDPQPSAEIRDLVWFGEHDDWTLLAPSLANRILPDLVARGLLPWERQPGASS